MQKAKRTIDLLASAIMEDNGIGFVIVFISFLTITYGFMVLFKVMIAGL